MALRCILSVIFHLSGFKLLPSPICAVSFYSVQNPTFKIGQSGNAWFRLVMTYSFSWHHCGQTTPLLAERPISCHLCLFILFRERQEMAVDFQPSSVSWVWCFMDLHRSADTTVQLCRIVPLGFSPIGSLGCFPQEKPAATVMLPSLQCMQGVLVLLLP